MQITIDPGLIKKCPRTALACVTARVKASASPAALLEEMKARETDIQRLPFPRGVLESPQVQATRRAYKALDLYPALCTPCAWLALGATPAHRAGRAISECPSLAPSSLRAALRAMRWPSRAPSRTPARSAGISLSIRDRWLSAWAIHERQAITVWWTSPQFPNPSASPSESQAARL